MHWSDSRASEDGVGAGGARDSASSWAGRMQTGDEVRRCGVFCNCDHDCEIMITIDIDCNCLCVVSDSSSDRN